MAPFSRSGVPFAHLKEQALLTPSCGLEGLTEDGAEARARTARRPVGPDAGKAAREPYHRDRTPEARPGESPEYRRFLPEPPPNWLRCWGQRYPTTGRSARRHGLLARAFEELEKTPGWPATFLYTKPITKWWVTAASRVRRAQRAQSRWAMR